MFLQRLRTTTVSSARPLLESYSKPYNARLYHSSSIQRCTSTAGTGPQKPVEQEIPLSFFKRLLNATYVLDTRLALPVLAFLVPSIGITATWLVLRLMEKKEALDWLDRHCTATLENVMEGRVYTLITSCFGAHGDASASGVAEACTFLLFGGNFIRSFGFKWVISLYMIGHVLMTSTFLGFNYLQYRDIVRYQENQVTPGKHDTAYTPRRDRRALVLAISRQTNETNPLMVKLAEEKQRNLIRMPEDQFLEHAKQYYLKKPSVSIGGGLFLSLLGLRLHPWSFIPVPFVPTPVAVFVPLQVMAATATCTDYAREDLISGLAPMMLAPFFAAFVLPRGNLHRYLPVDLINSMRMPKWLPRHLPAAPIVDLKKAAEEASKLAKRMNLPDSSVSQQQIEAMRKRNAKFQGKGKQ